MVAIWAGLASANAVKKCNAILQLCPVVDGLLMLFEYCGLNDVLSRKFGILLNWCKAPFISKERDDQGQGFLQVQVEDLE